ncbi:MAG: ABC transporter permease [Thermogutta sp.]|nr:ABC transporter permease [Thermogutta sp.]
MNLWKIAWRSIQHRAVSSALTAFSMALGVALVVAVLVIYQILDHSFKRSSQGYDLIVGPARGGSLELVLSTVYYLQSPRGTIPYEVYEDLHSGRFASEVEAAIPVGMGGFYAGFPVVGTVPEMFETFRYFGDRPYEFESGANFAADQPWQAVIGATVARRTGLGVGDKFKIAHTTSGQGTHEHAEEYEIMGVLKPTGTPVDRVLFINIRGFWEQHHQDRMAEAETLPPAGDPDAHAGHDDAHADAEAEAQEPPADDDRQALTAVLVKRDWTNSARAMELPRLITRESPSLQAVVPSEEVAKLFEGLLGNIQTVLLIFAVMIVVTAGIGLMVSIYNSMAERQLEIAVMRALGAKRSTVMLVVLLESILLSLGGGAFGVILGHGLIGAFSGTIFEQTGIRINALSAQPIELVLIPGLIALASIVGYMPALIAYRTDVAKALARGG